MAKRGFTAAERWAVYSVHGERCYLCTRPIDFQTMEVDHIIPETLLDTPEELAKILAAFGLKETFDLNDFANWMPACRPCNNDKRARVFKPSPMIQLQLEKTAEMASYAELVAEKTISDIKLSKLLGSLQVAAEQVGVDPEEINTLVVAFQAARERRARAERIVRGPVTKSYPTTGATSRSPAKAPATSHAKPATKAAGKAAHRPTAAKAEPKKAAAKAAPRPAYAKPHKPPRAFANEVPRDAIRLTPSLSLVYTPYGWVVKRS